MQKKLMALAVAGALVAPAALAQVQIGGGIHLQYFNHDPDAATGSTTDILTTSEPEIYFRGEEKLGGGMSVWFQCTSSFDVIGTASQSTTGAAQWCGRNSAIGFRGDFGNVFAGTWDTPHKLVSNMARGWWGGTNTLQGGSLVLLADGSQSNVGNVQGGFFRRQARSINYHSADWSGFNLNASFSAGNEATNIPDSASEKPRMYSIGGQFRTGPFFAGLGYEKHNDFLNSAGGVPVAGSDSSINVAVGFTFAGAVKVSALWMDNEYKPDVGNKFEDGGYAVYLDWTLGGPHKLYVQWAQRPEAKDGGVKLTDSGADLLGVAYGYSFSKRTQGYIAYNSLSNDPASDTSFGTGAASTGSKQTAMGVGLRHSF